MVMIDPPLTSYAGVYGEFTLKDLTGFPYIVYMDNQLRYSELETWYTGEALDTNKQGAQNTEDFPVRVNPIKTAAQKHVSALFGEFADGGDSPPVRFRVKPKSEDGLERAEKVEEALRILFSENNAGPAMIEGAIMSQIYGGCVFRLAWDPEDETLETGIRIDTIHPQYFIGIPDGNNFWKLREAWIVQQITQEEALRYLPEGMEIPSLYAYYIEHWTPTEYQIQINNVPAVYQANGEILSAAGTNVFGFVPFVYIPHIRSLSSFYGESIINDAVRSLLKELDKTIADAGDAISEDVHGYGVMSGVRGVPPVVEIADGLQVISLGMGSPTINGDTKPNLELLKRPQLSQPIVDLVDKLTDFLRRELHTPDVAYGEFGGGSQRSSSSLYTMMWHLTSHAKLERVWWTSGLRALAKMGLKMMAANGILGVTEEDTKMRVTIQWAEYLPRDRTELINELSVRAANNLGSLEHLLELAGDIDDVPQDIDKIKEWLTWLFSLQAKTMAMGNPGLQNNSDSLSKKKPAPSSAAPKPKGG